MFRKSWRHFLNLLPGLLLSLVMVWAVVRSVIVANWAPDLDLLVSIVLPALLVGVVFAGAGWLRPWVAHLLSAVLSVTWIVHRLGPLLDERLLTWRDQATELLIRTIIWGRVLYNGGRGEEIVLFLAALAFLGWFLGYATAWWLFRRGWVWLAVLINAAVILVNYAYALPKATGLFFVFLVAALLLIVRQQVLARLEHWSAIGVEYPDLLPLRLVTAAALACGVIILGTSLLPSTISSEQAERTWQLMRRPFVVAREQWEDAFSTINSPPGTSGQSFTVRSSTLGGGRVLGDEVVMYVQSRQFDYWRAVAFDKYTSQGWQNTTGEQARALLDVSTREQARTRLAAGQAMPLDHVQGRTLVTQTVRLAVDRKDDFLMAGGQVLQLSLPALIEHDYKVEQNRLQPNFDDTAAIVSQVPLRASTVYTVTSLVSVADVQSLRQAGEAYPDWVRRRYLQLPGSVSPRTIAKARELVRAADARTPYDQAVAIQNYLRTFPYNELVPPPPAAVDPVDYFLFEQQEGFCDYYASAMVVMLRSQGVPARWVQGYAGGVFDPEQAAFVVRENVAHSWPEVYFPGYGWQRFEPTPASYAALPLRPLTPPGTGGVAAAPDPATTLDVPSEPEQERLDPEDPSLMQESESLEMPGIAGMGVQASAQRLFTGMSILLGLLGLGVFGLVWRWRSEVGNLQPASAAYAQLGILAWLAGWPQRSHMTPHEYGLALTRRLPAQRAAIQRIVDAYVNERYRRSRRPVSRDLAAALRQVRRPLLQRMLHRWTWGLWPVDRRAARPRSRRS